MYNYDSRIQNNNIAFTAKPIPKKTLNTISKRLFNADKIDIYCHSSPDEDTINSMKVFYKWLKRMGKDVSICVNTKESRGLYFKHGNHNTKKDLKAPDVAFVLDFSGTERVPKGFINAFKNNKTENIIGLDHHNISDTFIKSPDLYVDNTAKSCCSMVFRFFEGLGIKLERPDLESIYCGMLSDFAKSKLVKIEKTPDGQKLIKLPKLDESIESKEILSKVEAGLSEKSKAKIYKHLDILSNLSHKEKSFQERIFNEIQVTNNGKLAYLKIDPNDREWASLGMDNTRTSTIIGNLRSRIINGIQNDEMISPKLKDKLKNVEGAIVFYRVADKGPYQMSITTKGDYAKRLIEYIKTNLNKDLIAGGHSDRAGGRVMSLQQYDTDKFVNDFLIAAENL